MRSLSGLKVPFRSARLARPKMNKERFQSGCTSGLERLPNVGPLENRPRDRLNGSSAFFPIRYTPAVSRLQLVRVSAHVSGRAHVSPRIRRSHGPRGIALSSIFLSLRFSTTFRPRKKHYEEHGKTRRCMAKENIANY